MGKKGYMLEERRLLPLQNRLPLPQMAPHLSISIVAVVKTDHFLCQELS